MREQQEGRQSKEPTYLRLELVRYARAQGIKPAALFPPVRNVRERLQQATRVRP